MASSLTKSFIAPISVTERMQREEDFFSRGFLMSYSGLNKLLYSPAAFYQHYVLKQRDDSQDQNMIEGSLIHCLLLRPTEFDNFFIKLFSLKIWIYHFIFLSLTYQFKNIKTMYNLKEFKKLIPSECF